MGYMSNKLMDKIEAVELDSKNRNAPIWLLSDLQAILEVEQLDESHWLVFLRENSKMHYALVSFYSSKPDQDNVKVTRVFEGFGYPELREFRHTFWGESADGYTFYLPIDATIKALTRLKDFFD